ncbi:hypothetical protein D1872_239920 [compost metagenome]
MGRRIGKGTAIHGWTQRVAEKQRLVFFYVKKAAILRMVTAHMLYRTGDAAQVDIQTVRKEQVRHDHPHVGDISVLALHVGNGAVADHTLVRQAPQHRIGPFEIRQGTQRLRCDPLSHHRHVPGRKPKGMVPMPVGQHQIVRLRQPLLLQIFLKLRRMLGGIPGVHEETLPAAPDVAQNRPIRLMFGVHDMNMFANLFKTTQDKLISS